MMGIARPDLRTPEVKAAANKISIGYGVCDHASFLCTECDQSSWLPTEIKHLPECSVGKILNF
jgi:hypothetical protein